MAPPSLLPSSKAPPLGGATIVGGATTPVGGATTPVGVRNIGCIGRTGQARADIARGFSTEWFLVFGLVTVTGFSFFDAS